MAFDLRTPIGLLFSAYGLLLTLRGLWATSSPTARSLGINVNLVWGGALLGFGVLLWIVARYARFKINLKSAVTRLENEKAGGPSVGDSKRP
jgi:hypothetical protein